MLSRKCAILSQHFCLFGYFYHSSRTPRNDPSEFDLGKFDFHVGLHFLDYNWFSLMQTSFGDCCLFQLLQYREQGQLRAGVSPEEYLENATSFKPDSHKKVNWISVSYLSEPCLNMIVQIGFGPGELKIHGRVNPDAPFAYPLNVGQDLVIVEASNLVRELTFEWFKEYVVCQDQNWICDRSNSSNDRNYSSFSDTSDEDISDISDPDDEL
ncbi:uncharacterized protein LOC142339339 isoform X2 [Convolutriloba macropyga]